MINKIRSFFIKDSAFNELLWMSIADNLKKLNKEADTNINIINLNLTINNNRDSLNNSDSNILNKSFSSSSSEDKDKNISTNTINTKKNSNKNILALIDEIYPPLKFCLLFMDVNEEETRIKYFIPIISHLLNIMKK